MTHSYRPSRILVLDADMVPALTIARSLDRHGYLVDVASARTSPITAYSSAVRDTYRYPDPLQDERSFLGWLANHQDSYNYDLIIPVTERSLVALMRHHQDLKQVPVAMAAPESLAQVLDKAATFRLAETLGVPTPRSVYVTSLDELEAASAQLKYPVVLKPSHSVSGGATGYIKRDVSYAGDYTSLVRQCDDQLRHSPVILQNYFSGSGAGIELIAREGQVLYAFQHLRLHEVPLTGGGSSFRKSTEINPKLLDAAKKLIKATRWHGVAMVEFKWDPLTDDFCLMEINGRFWGSLPLAAAAGADFPAMLAELLLEDNVGDYPDYRRNVYCRNLSKDLFWHEVVMRSKSDNITKVPGLGSVMRDLARIFSPHHYYDTQNLRDPLPGLVEIWRTAMAYYRRFFGLANETYFTLSQHLYWHNGTVRERLRAADSILFICYGNINRSALAEAMMNMMMPSSCGKQVNSSGFHPQEERPADHRMVDIAAGINCDLSQSRSSCISQEELDSSDILFVMEKAHHDRIKEMDPAAASRTFLLGAYPGGPGNIADPYNKSDGIYRTCFRQIAGAISRLSADI